MVRWRNFLILALLLLSPVRIGCDDDESEDDNDNDNGEDDDSEDDPEPAPIREVGRRAPAMLQVSYSTVTVTRTVPRRPLECYVCSYKSDAYLRSCLDPTKFRVHTMACHSVDDRCFTAVQSKGSRYESVMRGCRSGCTATPEVTCCASDRCNSQPFSMPLVAPKVQMAMANKSNKTIPPSVVFFVTILLVLQTVVKVAVV